MLLFVGKPVTNRLRVLNTQRNTLPNMARGYLLEIVASALFVFAGSLVLSGQVNITQFGTQVAAGAVLAGIAVLVWGVKKLVSEAKPEDAPPEPVSLMSEMEARTMVIASIRSERDNPPPIEQISIRSIESDGETFHIRGTQPWPTTYRAQIDDFEVSVNRRTRTCSEIRHSPHD